MRGRPSEASYVGFSGSLSGKPDDQQVPEAKNIFLETVGNPTRKLSLK
jgi:hypothetical protein